MLLPLVAFLCSHRRLTVFLATQVAAWMTGYYAAGLVALWLS